MKNSTQILSHLKHQPQFSKLAHYDCIKSVKNLFPPRLQQMILYGYIRNGVLFFVFNHPGAKQEFDIIIESIKAPLKAHMPASCAGSPFHDVKAFVSHEPLSKQEDSDHTVETYPERSQGNFDNPVTDQKLHDTIETIRQTILEQQSS